MSETGFERIGAGHVEALKLDVESYRHTATGAHHYHLAADDPNNAFLVAFLTVPRDSTGVAHILEHTSLCGSEHYPVRDPFFMMTRRSLNTFMNALTSSDWTAYPFASQNPKDFDNLLRVYLDAVFFPRLDELDFAQEGHRVEFDPPDDPNGELVFKGVVFNEMKGAMSSPVARLWHRLHEEIFPTITYHYNSGGDPEEIPNLTHAQLKAFHARHYHPSNAVFMTYGDAPAEVHQRRLEGYALNRFQGQEMDLRIPDERRYSEPRAVQAAYPLDGEEDTRHKTHVVVGWLWGKSIDPRENLTAHLLSGVLLDNSACPLRHALETTDLGRAPSELCGLDDSTREACFFAGLEGSDPEQAEATEARVLEVLREVAEHGVDRSIVESVLHQLELAQREISGGHFPYGLRLMMNALSPALQGVEPAAVLDIDPILSELRERIQDPGFIPGLVRDWLLDNPHRVRVVMAPDPELSQRAEARERERLKALQRGMSEAQRRQVIERARALLARQRQRDDPEVLPKVGLGDVPPELHTVERRDLNGGAGRAAWYPQATNGLVYQQVVTDLPSLDDAQTDLLPVFCDCLTEVGFGARDYVRTQAWQAAVTGGLGAHTSVRSRVDDTARGRGLFVLSGKALARNHEALGEVMVSGFDEARFDELPRLRELVAQLRAHREASVTDRGHVLAITAASAGMGPTAALAERWNGLRGVAALKALDLALEDSAELERFAASLAEVRDRIRAAPRQFLLICEESVGEDAAGAMQARWSGVPGADSTVTDLPGVSPARLGVAWGVSTQVSFCARAYPAVPVEHPDAAPLAVLGRFLTNGYLHRAVREEGGAYGGGAGYDSDTGALRFYSYRDPRLGETLEDFDASLGWLAAGGHTYAQLEEAILGIIAGIDRPESPAGEASKAFYGALHGRDDAQRRRFRERVLGVTLDDLQRVTASYLLPDRASTAVVSDPQTVEREAEALGLEVHIL